jgi:hypothetical protein
MISTLQQLVASSPLLGLSQWLRTDLILAATVLFLVFASWATLVSAQSSVHPGQVSPLRDRDSPSDRADGVRQGSRPGRVFGTFGILLGLLSSLALFAICAW